MMGRSLEHAAGQLLDGSLGAVVGHGLDEGEAARAAGFAVERNPDAAQLYAVARESLAQFLLGHGVREVADEKSSTHPSFWLAWLLLGSWGDAGRKPSALLTPGGC